jgi:SAM-dependent methyltransferase
MELHAFLQEIFRRPAPFESYTTTDLWADEHTSARMLEHHLDGSSNISSRNFDFIDRSASWLVRRFGLDAGRAAADFGCGPGLYTSRLAAAGATVTGIDFSARSLRYARREAELQGLTIDYIETDYLQFESDQRFDLITLIMCDYCALDPERRRDLLEVLRRHLAPGGAVVLDVYSLAGFDARREQSLCEPNLLDGFFSPEPYIGFLNTFRYEQEKVLLDKYTIVEKGGARVISNWFQYFSPETLTAELRSAGLEVMAVLADVAGTSFEPNGHEFAIVARHRTTSKI